MDRNQGGGIFKNQSIVAYASPPCVSACFKRWQRESQLTCSRSVKRTERREGMSVIWNQPTNKSSDCQTHPILMPEKKCLYHELSVRYQSIATVRLQRFSAEGCACASAKSSRAHRATSSNSGHEDRRSGLWVVDSSWLLLLQNPALGPRQASFGTTSRLTAISSRLRRAYAPGFRENKNSAGSM